MKKTNNTVFISGGSAGIGLAIAKEFSANGNKVIINGRNRERLDAALKQLKNASAIQGDLSIESERVRIAGELTKNFPDVNIIVNNAGEAYTYSLATGGNAFANASKEINTNYLSVIHFTELMLPHLIGKEQAAIVNVTSIVAFVPGAVVPTYSSSKSALRSYTQSLRTSLSDTSVRVFEVMPPLVNTDFSAPIGGANGIPPKEVADELIAALEHDRFDVPVGQTKAVFAAVHDGLSRLSKQSAAH